MELWLVILYYDMILSRGELASIGVSIIYRYPNRGQFYSEQYDHFSSKIIRFVLGIDIHIFDTRFFLGIDIHIFDTRFFLCIDIHIFDTRFFLCIDIHIFDTILKLK